MYNLKLEPNEEVQLLNAMQSGSMDAYAKIYRSYSARIYVNILKMVKDENEAQELLQDVFLKVWTKRQLVDPQQSFRSYLFQIAKNTVYNFIRKRNLDRQVENYMKSHLQEGYCHIEEDLIIKENEEWLLKTIEQLPPRRQQIFRLCKIEGKSYVEVSESLGISTSTINDHIVKATKFIKESYQNTNNTVLLMILFLFQL